MVAFLQRGDAWPHLDNDPCALVPQNRRENAFRVGTRERVIVGVANARGLDLDQHFAGLGALKVDGFNGQRGARFPGNCSFRFHGEVSASRVSGND